MRRDRQAVLAREWTGGPVVAENVGRFDGRDFHPAWVAMCNGHILACVGDEHRFPTPAEAVEYGLGVQQKVRAFAPDPASL